MSGRPFEKTINASMPKVLSLKSDTREVLSSQREGLSETTKSRLWRLNNLMFLFHTGFLITTLVLGDLDLMARVNKVSLSTANMSLEMFGNFSSQKVEEMPDGWDDQLEAFLAPGTELRDWGLPLTWLVGVFFFLSAFFHFGNANIWWKGYVRNLEAQANPYRWMEYTLSASTMILIVSYSSGINLELDLLMIFVLIATTMFFGHLTEEINKKDEFKNEWTLPLCRRMIPHLMGYLPQITAWFVIVFVFMDNSEGAPDFVVYIIWGQLALFFSFGFVQLAVILRKPSYYVYGEVAYQFLSIFAKGFLGVIMLTNVIFLSAWPCVVEDLAERLPKDYC